MLLLLDFGGSFLVDARLSAPCLVARYSWQTQCTLRDAILTNISVLPHHAHKE